MGLFDIFFKRKVIEALPEPKENEVKDAGSLHRDFIKRIKGNTNSQNTIISAEPVSKDKESKVYSIKNYMYDWKIYKWYMDQDRRNEYYSSQNESKDLEYDGAVEVHINADKSKSIMLTTIGDDKEKFKVEIGRFRGNHKDVTKKIDQILAIQLGGVYSKEKFSEDEVKRLYNELIVQNGLNLTKIGKQILLNSDRRDIVIEDVEEEEKLRQARERKLKELNKQIDEVCDFCRLAIDIGVFSEEDWKKVDKNPEVWMINKKLKEKGKMHYSRDAHWRRESYDRIKKEYMDKEDLKLLNKGVSDKLKLESQQGFDSATDVEEVLIRAYMREVMLSMPLKYENEILAYQIIYEDNEECKEKQQLLGDMVAFAKVKYLEEKGIVLDKYKNKNQERIA